MPTANSYQNDIMSHRVKECNNSCSHYDDFNRFCWILWDYVQEGDMCKVELKDDSYE